MIGFNQKNTIDNPLTTNVNLKSHPFDFYYQRGSLPYDLMHFQQRCDRLEEEGILPPTNQPKKETVKYEDLKLPELMPYRNNTPPYQRERYKQNMKMKSLDTIIKYKQLHEKVSSFQMKALEPPTRFYKNYFNGDPRIGKQQLLQSSYKSQYEQQAGNQAQFQSNIPNYYAQREVNNPLKNVQMQNLHQYKVIASENENYVNYNIYNNEYPQVVDAIKSQYERQKEQISNEPSFFQKRRALDYNYKPLAAVQYDPPKKTQQSDSDFRLMMPVLPVYVPLNEQLPKNYSVVMPQVPSQETAMAQQLITQSTKSQRNISQYENASNLQAGKFANGQEQNRFIQPKAKRYEPEKRYESMNKKYKPDLLPRGDKAGYNMNPHSTAINVVYQRQINDYQKQVDDIETQQMKEQQDAIDKQKQEEQYAKNLAKIFKN